MGCIRLLDDHLASQVAAGEVVERPASILKELVENSLDAEAKKITVRFAGGGEQLLEVEDDGLGMDRDDALLSIERHATSKIRASGDLAVVATHGFRGEALPSIASVSRFRMLTWDGSAHAATEMVVEGGKLLDVREAGTPRGTLIQVRNLFFNVPARRKFLRSRATEASHLIHQFETAALSRPDVHWELYQDGRLRHRLPRVENLATRAMDLFGREEASIFRETREREVDGIRLRGLLAPPSGARSDRSRLFVYINGRAVQDAVILRALRDALAAPERGRNYPSAILLLEMDPLEFDCNVHPAKREVRFHRPAHVREAVAAYVREELQRNAEQTFGTPLLTQGRSETSAVPQPVPILRTGTLPMPPARQELPPTPAHTPAPPPENRRADVEQHREIATPDPSSKPEANTQQFRLLGTLGERYLVLESTDGLVLVDQRHSMERILYEELITAYRNRAVSSQPLLIPEVVDRDRALAAWALENRQELSALGFEIEAFGDDTVKIDAVPAMFSDADPAVILRDLSGEIAPGERVSPGRAAGERLMRAACLVRSRKANPESLGDGESFLKRLLACELPYASPGGQPTMLQIGWSELARKFGRSGEDR